MLTRAEVHQLLEEHLIDTPYMVIAADGKTTEHQVSWPESPRYEEMRQLISGHLDGATIERVSVLWGWKDREPARLDMFVDAAFQRRGLATNALATRIYRNNTLTQHPHTVPDQLPYIAGPAVLFSRRIWF